MKKVIGSSRSLFAVLLIIVLAVGGLWLAHSHSNSKTQQNANKPTYLSFAGNYTFTIPDSNIVDEHAITGMQLVYSSSLSAKTIEDVYSAGAVTIQPLTFLTDHSGKAFKKYVNETFAPDVKKNISSDVKVKFEKVDGWDVAKVAAKKDGQVIRFAYLKNGQHPAAVVSKTETDPLKKIEQTMRDAESTNLKSDVGPIRQTVLTAAQQIKAQKAHDLYVAASPDLRTKSSEADLSNALAAIKEYTQGNIAIDGGSFNNGEFTAIIQFTPLNKDIHAASGAMSLNKADGQWKLKSLTLPKQ